MTKWILFPGCVAWMLASLVAARAQAGGEVVYVSNERSGEVSVIDAASLQVIAIIPAGKRPRSIHCAPDGRRVYVTLTGSPRMAPGVEPDRAPKDKAADGIAVIDPKLGKVTAFLHVGANPVQLALSADGAVAFLSNEDEASASAVDLASGKVVGTAPVSQEPEGVGINPVGGQVFVTCEAQGLVYVLDPHEMREVAHFKVGGRPRSVAFTPDGARAYVPSETDSLVSVVDALHYRVTDTIRLSSDKHPVGTAVSPDGRELYVSTGRGNTVEVIDTGTDGVLASIPVGGRVWGIGLNAAGDRLYAANGTTNDVSVVDVKARKELTRVKVGEAPWGLAVGPKFW